MDLGLRGKVALVAASSKGLGKACALELAREGARVVVSSRDAARVESTANEIASETGSEVLSIAADLIEEGEIERLVSSAVEGLGPIEILVTNSGPPRGGRFEELSDRDWEQAFRLVTLSVVRLVRLVLPGMRERGWGRVISIQSTSVKQPIPHLVLSNAVRPGTQGILKSLVEGAAKDGVTVNTVLPGMFLTDRLLDDLRDRAERAGISTEDQVEEAGRFNPTGRVGDPGELACAVALLASERASFINGATLQIDGGSVRALA